jgi:hypothetical protein
MKRSQAVLNELKRAPAARATASSALEKTASLGTSVTAALLTQAQRSISSTSKRFWDEIRAQTHAGEILNPNLRTPPTVSIIGAPMTCKHCD